MKKLVYLIVLVTTLSYGQSNNEIADIYLVKSEEQLKKKELSKALVYFDRAKNLLGDKSNAKVEEIGTMIYYNLKDYKVAKEHAKNYFALTTEKGSDRYNEVLYLYVEIEELIDEENKVKAELLAAELLRKKEATRLDSLTEVWYAKSKELSVSADTIYSFDKNSVAVFKNDKGFYGIIDDKGNELISPVGNTGFMHYDGKIVLMEGVKDLATKITVYNSATKQSSVLPAVSQFNALSTNYGKVMLPRDNGLVITYPNNSNKVLVYDLNSQSFKKASNLEKYFDYWKGQKVIKKYNKENQIRIDKEYLDFGGDLGGCSAFYNEDGSLFGFISVGGSVLLSSQFKHIGTLSNGFLEAEKQDGTIVWLNEKGKEIEALVNKNGTYNGLTVLKKVDSNYQFFNEKNEVMKNGETLESLEEFLKTH